MTGSITKMKVAIAHDYLREYGGAERVVEELHDIFPDAPVYTAYYNPKGLGIHNQRIKNWDIRSSWIQNLPFANKLISPLRIFAPRAFRSFDLSEYDLVVSSSAIYFAKAVATKPKTLHIAYIHTPPRYLYGYVTSYNYKKHWWTRIGGEAANHFLRIVDFETSRRPDILVANSKNVAARIRKFYRRDAMVIYPPVDTMSFPPRVKLRDDMGGKLEDDKESEPTNKEVQTRSYFLSLGRLVRGKGLDIIIAACNDINAPLKIAGSGPILGELKKMAGKSVEFLGPVSDQERARLYSNAKAFIVCSEDEDFGITGIEAMAAGTPVISIAAGGYLETVIKGKTGEFFDGSVKDLTKVLENFDPKKYREEDCRKQAEKFSKERFKKEILALVANNLKG